MKNRRVAATRNITRNHIYLFGLFLMSYQVVPVPIIRDPYSGLTRAQLLNILMRFRALHQDPKYPELFRAAWKDAGSY